MLICVCTHFSSRTSKIPYRNSTYHLVFVSRTVSRFERKRRRRKSYWPRAIVSKPVLIYALRHGTAADGFEFKRGHLFFYHSTRGHELGVSRCSKRFPLGGKPFALSGCILFFRPAGRFKYTPCPTTSRTVWNENRVVWLSPLRLGFRSDSHTGRRRYILRSGPFGPSYIRIQTTTKVPDPVKLFLALSY